MDTGKPECAGSVGGMTIHLGNWRIDREGLWVKRQTQAKKHPEIKWFVWRLVVKLLDTHNL